MLKLRTRGKQSVIGIGMRKNNIVFVLFDVLALDLEAEVLELLQFDLLDLFS